MEASHELIQRGEGSIVFAYDVKGELLEHRHSLLPMEQAAKQLLQIPDAVSVACVPATVYFRRGSEPSIPIQG